MNYRSLYILCLVLFNYRNVSAQSIVAGEGDCTQFSMTYSPPLVIYEYITNGPQHDFDINGDGVPDLTAGSEGYNGGNYSQSICSIKPLGQNEIAWGRNDSTYQYCNGNPPVNTGYTRAVPNIFLHNDVIDANQVWQKNELYFKYYDRSFSCSSSIAGLDIMGAKIIGIRIITATDTLYGWIQFSVINSNFMSISGFASEAKLDNQISIRPNPFVGDLTVKLKQSTLNTPWYLYDQFGRTVMNGVFENINNTLESSELAAGIYFLKTNYSTTKLVKVTP
jgi:hypothetical protein